MSNWLGLAPAASQTSAETTAKEDAKEEDTTPEEEEEQLDLSGFINPKDEHLQLTEARARDNTMVFVRLQPRHKDSMYTYMLACV